MKDDEMSNSSFIQSQNVSSTTAVSVEEGLAAARRQCDASETASTSTSKSNETSSTSKSKSSKSSDSYNSLLPGGAIAQLAMDPYVESYGAGDDEDAEGDFYGAYDYADPYTYGAYGYEDVTVAAPGEEDSSETTTTTDADAGTTTSAPDGKPIVYGTPIVPLSHWIALPTNPYPHVPLNVDHCVIDPIKETSPSLSLPVLSKVARSMVHVPSAGDGAQNVTDANTATNPELTGMSKKALAKAAKPGPTLLPLGKNPVQFLNEQMPGLPFECVSRMGADNKPTFTMKVRQILYVRSDSPRRLVSCADTHFL